MYNKKALWLGKVVSNREIVEGYLMMSVRLSRTFEAPLPGQFVMIRSKERAERLLGRPFSVCRFQRGKNSVVIEILYRVVGDGTYAMSRLKRGSELEILGPLGRPFEVIRQIRNIVLIAGGIGVAPIRFLLEHLKKGLTDYEPRIRFYMGAKTAGELIGLNGLEVLCEEVKVCTDDCSMGHHGFVTQPLEQDLKSFPLADTMIYACGPVGMIRQLAGLLEGHPVPCQVSMEERMACGLGACLGCAIAVKGRNGVREYRRVCKDGPVFDIRDIRWDKASEDR
jgi:dihydroorotate dehydrogenase electron transfer subunit